MRLTSDQFERALMALARRSGSKRGGGDERRSDPRVQAAGIVVLTPENADDIPIHARLRDISRGGVGFSHHTGLVKGCRMTVRLHATAGTETQPIRCEVRHCEQTGDNAFLIGIAFLD
jgi:c-di-GMP-binding flagellar brake protein YcgR